MPQPPTANIGGVTLPVYESETRSGTRQHCRTDDVQLASHALGKQMAEADNGFGYYLKAVPKVGPDGAPGPAENTGHAAICDHGRIYGEIDRIADAAEIRVEADSADEAEGLAQHMREWAETYDPEYTDAPPMGAVEIEADADDQPTIVRLRTADFVGAARLGIEIIEWRQAAELARKTEH